ncbi:MAG TPA: phosphate signaling complex protein PhoU [Defluviitoga sp.]|nr:phosphate signaling complex protein PhoU [Defluviitoga sp.]HOP23945.1 phosphate signaling complex protein PhoU [Defluviitoga sp.]HPZ28880.1 phosphate signaling complex protein PhoU [Defluviitoga sp.]HQD62266.1 phosphate signaling complex protein PhoU [Defluviitoga sp.]
MDLTRFEIELTQLKGTLSKLLSEVLKMLEDSISSLKNKDLVLAQKIIASDEEIDELNRQIEESVYQILARFRPMGKDLRYAITMIKLANDLERIGDLSCNIAEKTQQYENYDINEILETKELKQMLNVAVDMIKGAYKAFEERDVDSAIEIWKRDDIVDALEIEVRKRAINRLSDPDFSQELVVPYILLARDIERIADHATNLCEELVYIEIGREILYIVREEQENKK